jgi:serine phosphatase RsbU (regulator of sigma subunit)
VRDGVLTAASAGHPAPVVLCGADARELPLEPGPPLALEMTDTLPRLSEHRTDIAAGSLLALYTDGLTDHRGSGGTDLDVMALVRPVAATGEPQEVARLLLAAADAAGAAVDDTTVLVARI